MKTLSIYSLLFCTWLSLTGCGSTPESKSKGTQRAADNRYSLLEEPSALTNYQPQVELTDAELKRLARPQINEFTPAQLDEVTNVRTVYLKINSNWPNLQVDLVTDDESKRTIPIGKTPISGEYSLPNGKNLVVKLPEPLASSHSFSSRSKRLISADTTHFQTTLEVISTQELLKEEFNSLPSGAKIGLAKAVALLDIASKSPKFLVESKIAEAEGHLSVATVEYPQLKDTNFALKLKVLAFELKAAAYLGYMLEGTSNNLRLVKMAIQS